MFGIGSSWDMYATLEPIPFKDFQIGQHFKYKEFSLEA